LVNNYSKKYSGGDPDALTDGKVSVDDLSQVEDRGVWQGFEEKDMIATIDLINETEIHTISAGFLHNTDSWIFSPDWVEFMVSNDNDSYRTIGKLDRMVQVKSGNELRLNYVISIKNTSARYVRIQAKNVGVCPRWHKGAGGKAWLFADEIIVN